MMARFKDFSPIEKIDYAARYIIIHSIIYYELHESVISDSKFDKKSAILVKLMKKYPKTTKKSPYYKAIHDFDGTTGFHLYYRLTKEEQKHHMMIARHVLYLYKRRYLNEGS